MKKQENTFAQLDQKEDKCDIYKTTVKDARYIFVQYRDKCPPEAWETLRRILFNPKLK